jgi:tetratricopeptide (TPR) repeat protein
MKQNFCSSCGNKITENSRYCPQCGVKIDTGENTQKTKVPVEKKTLARSNSFVLLSLSIAFALVVILLVLDSNDTALQQKVRTVANLNPQQQEQVSQMMERIKNVKKQLETDPTNYALLVEMGNGNFDIGRYKEAISYYRRATFVNSSDPNVLIDLGVAYFNMSKADSALMYMNHALKIDPLNAQGLYNTGIVHFSIGDSLKAITQWEKLIEANSGTPQAQAAKKFIEKLKSETTKS